MLGTAYSELGRRKEARAQFDLVLKDDPQSVQGLIGMANLLVEEGRTDDVIALCKRTLSLDERNSQAHTLLGEAYASRREPEAALPHFEKAVEIQPKLTRNRLNLAGALIEVRQHGRAEALLNEIVKEYPKFPFAHFNLGLLYDEQRRFEEARSAYAAEVSAYPQHFKARFNLGKVLFQLGDHAGSLEQMREVVRLAPRQPEGTSSWPAASCRSPRRSSRCRRSSRRACHSPGRPTSRRSAGCCWPTSTTARGSRTR
jgi:tetratricopeptide (TPR) repeat protein